MHIPTMALFAIYLYILGRPTIVHAQLIIIDAYDSTKIGVNCAGRIYNLAEIYAAAHKYCIAFNKIDEIRNRTFAETGYRHKSYAEWDQSNIGSKSSYHSVVGYYHNLVPILKDVLFPYGLSPLPHHITDVYGRSVETDPGVDRLVIDDSCKLLNVVIDLNPGISTDGPWTTPCKLIDAPSNKNRNSRSPDRAPPPAQYRERTPTRSRKSSLERAPPRPRVQSPQ